MLSRLFIGAECSRETIGAECSRETIGAECSRETIGAECSTETNGATCSRETIGAECSELLIAQKNVPEKRFIGENNVPDRQTIYHSKNKKVPQRQFIEAKYSGLLIARKKFRTGYASEENVPDRLFIGAANIANGKLHTKLVQIYFP